MATLKIDTVSYTSDYNFVNAMNGNLELMHYQSKGIRGRAKIVVWDKDYKNSLDFSFGRLPTQDLNAYKMLMVMCWNIAYGANGNIRKLVEDHRVLFLMKECDLHEICHYNTTRREFSTVWTEQDADALND